MRVTANLAQDELYTTLIVLRDYIHQRAPFFNAEAISTTALILATFGTDPFAAQRLNAADREILLDMHAALSERASVSSLRAFRRAHDNVHASLPQLLGRLALALAAVDADGTGDVTGKSASIAYRRVSRIAAAEGLAEVGFSFEPPTASAWAQLIVPADAFAGLVERGAGNVSLAIIHERNARALAPSEDSAVFELFGLHVSGLDPGTLLGAAVRFVALPSGVPGTLAEYECGWWNASRGDKGAWQLEGCQLHKTLSELECQCKVLGVMALLPPGVAAASVNDAYGIVTEDDTSVTDAQRISIPSLACMGVGVLLLIALIATEMVQRVRVGWGGEVKAKAREAWIRKV